MPERSSSGTLAKWITLLTFFGMLYVGFRQVAIIPYQIDELQKAQAAQQLDHDALMELRADMKTALQMLAQEHRDLRDHINANSAMRESGSPRQP